MPGAGGPGSIRVAGIRSGFLLGVPETIPMPGRTTPLMQRKEGKPNKFNRGEAGGGCQARSAPWAESAVLYADASASAPCDEPERLAVFAAGGRVSAPCEWTFAPPSAPDPKRTHPDRGAGAPVGGGLPRSTTTPRSRGPTR